MTKALRDAWANLIRAEDYEAHMAAVGQAQANAHLVADYFLQAPLLPGARILFLGAGTGQVFDYVSPAFLPALSHHLQRPQPRLFAAPE